MSDNQKVSEFEQILNRSFDLAVQLQHEYVTLEHVLMACLDSASVIKLVKDLGVDHKQLHTDLNQFLCDPHRHAKVEDVRFQPKYTHTVLTVVKQAKAQSLFLGKSIIDGVDIVLAIFNTKESWAVYFMNKHQLNKNRISEYLSTEKELQDQTVTQEDAKLMLAQYAINLNKRALQNRIDPLIGRESDVDILVHTLARKLKNNVLLVGHPGVGKTQIVEGLARMIVQKQVPHTLSHKEIWSLDVSALIAGTKFRGDFEERMKNLIQAIKSLPDVILFIDEIHMIMGAGSGGGQSSMDVANILKPALSRGEIMCVGSTTHEEYRKHFEKDRALLRRFHKQDVLEPSAHDSKLILKGILQSFETFHGVKYHADCVDASVDLSVKFIQNKYLPDKAIDLIDAAGAACKLQKQEQVQVHHIEQQLSTQARISLDAVKSVQTEVNKNLMQHVQNKLFGQSHAVTQVVEHVWMTLSGLRENNKTMGSFLFVGPSGTGKCLAYDQEITVQVPDDLIEFAKTCNLL